MNKRWVDDWYFEGLPPVKTHIALSRLFVGDEIKALIAFRGASQRHFYVVTRFDAGVSSKESGEFPSLEAAKSAVEGSLA